MGGASSYSAFSFVRMEFVIYSVGYTIKQRKMFCRIFRVTTSVNHIEVCDNRHHVNEDIRLFQFQGRQEETLWEGTKYALQRCSYQEEFGQSTNKFNESCKSNRYPKAKDNTSKSEFFREKCRQQQNSQTTNERCTQFQEIYVYHMCSARQRTNDHFQQINGGQMLYTQQQAILLPQLQQNNMRHVQSLSSFLQQRPSEIKEFLLLQCRERRYKGSQMFPWCGKRVRRDKDKEVVCFAQPFFQGKQGVASESGDSEGNSLFKVYPLSQDNNE